MSVIGSMILSRSAVEDVAVIVGAGDFYRPAHEVLFQVITQMHGRGEPVDAVTLAAEVTRQGVVRQVGGLAYLHELAAFPPSAANAAFYAQAVAEAAVYRRMVAAGTKITQLGYQAAVEGGQVDAAVESAKDAVDLIGGVGRASITMFGDVADDAIDTIGKARFTPTPWRNLNRFIYGWMPGHMYTLGARPAIGKTVLAVQAAIDAARGLAADPLGVAYYTFEMSGRRLYQRGLAYVAGVDGERMMRADIELTDAEWRAIANADGVLRVLPFVVESCSGWTASRVVAHAHAANRRYPLGLVVVDHIGLVSSPDSRMSEQAVLSDASDKLLQLAHDVDAAVLVVSQVNRGPSERRDRKPRVEDLRGSDKMEQNSDVVMLGHRDKLNSPADFDLLVAKHRDGQDGRVPLTFEGAYSRITDRDPSGVPVNRGRA